MSLLKPGRLLLVVAGLIAWAAWFFMAPAKDESRYVKITGEVTFEGEIIHPVSIVRCTPQRYYAGGGYSISYIPAIAQLKNSEAPYTPNAGRSNRQSSHLIRLA